MSIRVLALTRVHTGSMSRWRLDRKGDITTSVTCNYVSVEMHLPVSNFALSTERHDLHLFVMRMVRQQRRE
jgi:hypothetical protein